MQSHPDIVANRKSDSPDEEKRAHDSKLLIPTLNDFFKKHPLINPKVFLGDAAFDSTSLYQELLSDEPFGKSRHFAKAYILLNSRARIENLNYARNERDIPCCPHDSSIPLKYERTSKLRGGVTRYKFACPKIKWVRDKSAGKYHTECQCTVPCTSSNCDRMVYIYSEKNLRAYPSVIRGTEEWNNTYKIRTVVEKKI